MQIRKIFDLNGPNIWTNTPALEAWVDLGHFEELPTNKLPGFTERIMAHLPSLIEHRCSIGERGGFLQRLETGTWLGHVLEHVTLELQSMAFAPVGFGRARETLEYGVYKVVVRCENARFAETCMRSARELILATIEDRPFDLEGELKRLRGVGDQWCLGPGTRAIVEAARARGVPHLRLNDGNLIQLGYGKAQRRIWTAETDCTSAVAESIAQDKDLTRRLLAAAGVPVPAGRAVSSAADAWLAAQELEGPVVVKPIDGNYGRGVSIKLDTEAAIREAYDLAAKEGSGVVVESFIPGTQHRVLVVGDKAVASVRGDADVLTGDGVSTIVQLVEQANRDPRRGQDHQTWVLTRIELTPIVLELLHRQDLAPDSIPAAGQQVLIQLHGDLTVDETERIHPEVAAMCVLAVQTVGLDIAGLDVVAADIGVPLSDQGGAVIEVNASPGLLAHLKPLAGKPQPVGEAIVDRLFAGEDQGRIPLVAVSGTEGRAKTTQSIARCLAAAGHQVVRADSSGLFLGERALRPGAADNALGARHALMNPGADAAVLEVSELSVLEEGLCFDACQVAVVTTTRGAEAVARPGVEDRTAIDKAIRAPADVVISDGFSVLNADDEAVVAMAERVTGNLMWFGGSLQASPVKEHVESGGAALVRLGSQLQWWVRGELRAAFGVAWMTESTPRTLVEPLMAAAAAVLALGVSRGAVMDLINKSAQ
ncbi:MAG: cyanophycin synthetase [Polyangiaceae bacterium]|nr:cyanophycin synthetase [Polyangiaceae bacterium]